MAGLKFNPYSENLFIKAIKIEEKMNNFTEIRSMIKRIQDDRDASIEQSWKILIEGALFEGRCGNRKVAREQFGYLLKKCRNYGPIFLEASKYEERENEVQRAIDICEDGLKYNSKYSPLWFQYIRLQEKKGHEQIKCLGEIYSNISKEFQWKINIELAQTYERLGFEQKTNEYLKRAVMECPDNVKWKIWMIAARLMQN